jgi:hypothetical protein
MNLITSFPRKVGPQPVDGRFTREKMKGLACLLVSLAGLSCVTYTDAKMFAGQLVSCIVFLLFLLMYLEA